MVRYIGLDKVKRARHPAKQPEPLPTPEEGARMRIAFVQLGSWGDCINSTLMFAPIKRKWPNCRLEVHTTTLYASAFHNNPYVDALHQTPAATKAQVFSLYDVVPKRITGYDKVLTPAPILYRDQWRSAKHPELGYNLWCTFLKVMEDNGIDYELPVQGVLRLTDGERDKGAAEAAPHAGKRRILMEVHGESGQTFWDDNWTLKVGRHLLRDGTALFISNRNKTNAIQQLQQLGAVFVGGLTLRECAELYNHCNAFLSVSSGLCNACNTDWCNRNTTSKWFEVVNSNSCDSSVLRRDRKTFFYENNVDKYIELLKAGGL